MAAQTGWLACEKLGGFLGRVAGVSRDCSPASVRMFLRTMPCGVVSPNAAMAQAVFVQPSSLLQPSNQTLGSPCRYLMGATGDRDMKLVLEAFQMSVAQALAHPHIPGLLRLLMAGRLMAAPLSPQMQVGDGCAGQLLALPGRWVNGYGAWMTCKVD